MNTGDAIALGTARTPASRSTIDKRSKWRRFFRGIHLPLRGFHSDVSQEDGMRHERDTVGARDRAGLPARALETKRPGANSATFVANLDMLHLTHDAICVRDMNGVIE